jgi:hypothetical protein
MLFLTIIAQTLVKADQEQADLAEAKTTFRPLNHVARKFAKQPATRFAHLPAWQNAPKFPQEFEFFRVEWERAA